MPVFLAGCSSLVVLGGPHWPTRLWCIIEVRRVDSQSPDAAPSLLTRSRISLQVFTFLAIGSDHRRLRVVPLTPVADPTEPDLALAHMLTKRSCKRLDVKTADCYAADKDRLLGAIESGFASIDQFNTVCQTALTSALERQERVAVQTKSYRAAWVSMGTTSRTERSERSLRPNASSAPVPPAATPVAAREVIRKHAVVGDMEPAALPAPDGVPSAPAPAPAPSPANHFKKATYGMASSLVATFVGSRRDPGEQCTRSRSTGASRGLDRLKTSMAKTMAYDEHAGDDLWA